jgi:hypothetical protein
MAEAHPTAVAVRGARICVRGRLQDMIRAEISIWRRVGPLVRQPTRLATIVIGFAKAEPAAVAASTEQKIA